MFLIFRCAQLILPYPVRHQIMDFAAERLLQYAVIDSLRVINISVSQFQYLSISNAY